MANFRPGGPRLVLQQQITSVPVFKQRFYFPAELFIRAGFVKERCAIRWLPLKRGEIEVFHLPPAIRRHSVLPAPLRVRAKAWPDASRA